MQTRPDYLVIGHVAKDLQPGDAPPHPGGTAIYSAITAQRLGLQAAIVTALAPEDSYLLDSPRDEGIWIHAAPSLHTTTFRNTYDAEGHRTQLLPAHASPISPADVPDAWRAAPIVHLGPVAQELPAGMAGLFPPCLLGITPQGWMRSWDKAGHVRHSALPINPALYDLPPGAIIVLSMEDIAFDTTTLDQYTALVQTVIVTQSAGEALIFTQGHPTGSVPACVANPIDPTGAGDVFAAAFFIRYHETSSLIEAARFAHAAAARAIEAYGTEGIAHPPPTHS
jgi:sugar/nucleoside kinase (ribokinase family)